MIKKELEISIIPFEDQYAKDFYELNIEWLNKYFYVEAYDEMILSNPKKHIISKGGHIFLAKIDEEIAGVVALIHQESFYELSKMAVSPKYQGKKIGLQLVEYCLKFATSQGWDELILYSDRSLVPAINLYKKVGFEEIPLEKDVHYERADIKMRIAL